MPAEDIVVDRPRSAEDWQAVRDINCETGAAGAPVKPRNRWPFFAEFWVGPYQRLLPEWTLVARAGGKVVGYLTGCPDSLPFYARRFFLHRLPLALGIFLGRFGATEDVRRFLHPGEGVRRNFAIRFGFKLYWHLMTRHPAHLHINVREGHRGGTGRKIMDAYVAALAEAGVRGLHLFCGANPVPFYRRVGFHKLACIDFGKGPVYVMVRRIQKRR
ncbi:MAG: hypothetical protein HY553_16210 [Elusimicrobia bacterium]|nr:hypothetical protein [Elusimicrobiota bacterium]